MKGIKAIILPDVHIDHKGYDKVYLPVRKFIKDFKPDTIYLLGDFADCSSLSNWDLSRNFGWVKSLVGAAVSKSSFLAKS